MRTRRILIVAACLITFSPGSGLCHESASSRDDYQKFDTLVDQGEYRQAWELIRNLEQADSTPGQRYWRMARVQYEMGRQETSPRGALAYFQAAENFARQAIDASPAAGEGYKWLAIALGVQAKEGDIETRIRLSVEVRNNIEKAIALAPQDDLAYLILSRWHYKIASLDYFSRAVASIIYGELPEASFTTAEHLLQKAIALHDRSIHHYYLARVYERMGRGDEAKVQLQTALNLPATFQEEFEVQEKSRRELQSTK